MTKTTNDEAGPVVVLAIAGSIAAYKAVLVARQLIANGVTVVPIMTRSATRFVGAATLAGITGQRVRTSMWSETADGTEPGEPHVALGVNADVVAVVPATADLLAGMASGRADDLVRATLLCTEAPIIAAPAMHPRMWNHPATQRNVAQIAADGRVELVGPVFGAVASGDEGLGRMAEPEAIAAAIMARLQPRDLDGLHVVVTAGPTVEDLDPARYLSNRSSGKMGFAVAERAAARGAKVTLVAGPVNRPTPRAVDRVDVRSATEMQAALDDTLGDDLQGADVLVMVAAVADYRPADVHTEKMKRTGDDLTLKLTPNPDLLAGIGARRTGTRPFLVGFALETASGEALVKIARGKLERKGVDMVVANRASDAFDRDDNRIILVTADTHEVVERAAKTELADRILDRVVAAKSEAT